MLRAAHDAGVVMYEVIGERQLLDVGQSLYEYRSKIASFMQLDLSAVPYELQTLLGQMLSTTPAARPSAISITGSQHFQVHPDIEPQAHMHFAIALHTVSNASDRTCASGKAHMQHS